MAIRDELRVGDIVRCTNVDGRTDPEYSYGIGVLSKITHIDPVGCVLPWPIDATDIDTGIEVAYDFSEIEFVSREEENESR